MTRKTPTPPRWYDDACGTAHALELVGERWALLVVRELMWGPRRFGELRDGLPGISANALTQRLESLEAAGILQRRQLPPPASAQVYELTPWGYEMEPVFQATGRWAARSPSHDPSLPISAASILLSMRTMFARDRAAGLDAHLGVRFGRDAFSIHATPREVTIRRAEPAEADVVVTTDPATLGALLYGGRTVADAERAGALAIEGDRAILKRFLRLFVLPPKAEASPTR